MPLPSCCPALRVILSPESLEGAGQGARVKGRRVLVPGRVGDCHLIYQSGCFQRQLTRPVPLAPPCPSILFMGFRQLCSHRAVVSGERPASGNT